MHFSALLSVLPILALTASAHPTSKRNAPIDIAPRGTAAQPHRRVFDGSAIDKSGHEKRGLQRRVKKRTSTAACAAATSDDADADEVVTETATATVSVSDSETATPVETAWTSFITDPVESESATASAGWTSYHNEDDDATITASETAAASATSIGGILAAVDTADASSEVASTSTSSAAASSTSSTSSGSSHDGQSTYYVLGTGTGSITACGGYYTDSDYIAAVSASLFDSYPGYSGTNSNDNPICGKQAKVTYGTSTVTVTVEDRCVGCSEYDLDLSPDAFEQLADLGVGRMDMSWEWI